MTPLDIPKSAALLALQEQRQLYRAKLEADQAALDRAARNVSDWTQQQATAEQAAAENEAEQCTRLASWIAADQPSAAPAAEHDSAAARQLAHTHLNLGVAEKAQAALQAAHQATTGKLAALEADIEAEAEGLLIEAREAQAEQVERTHARFVAEVATLRALSPDFLRTPLNVPWVAASERVQAALALLPEDVDGINTPLNYLRGGFHSSAPLDALRAALIAE